MEMILDRGDIPAEALARIGLEQVRTYEVTAREIRRFAQAVGETNPIHQDEEYAASTPEGGLVAPALFTQVFTYDDIDPALLPADGSPKELDVPLPTDRAVGGGSEYEIFAPVRAGDVLTVSRKLKDVYSKNGKSGQLFFVVVETEFRTEAGAPVARETATYIKRG
jgi:acyl dehydratase